jgi:hypothetical protein
MIRSAILALSVVLVGCDKEPTKQELEMERAAAKAASKAKIAQRLAQPLEPRVIEAGPGQLLVLDIPEASIFGSSIDIKRCYVWRDSEFKTAAMSCPSEPELRIER